APPRGDLPARLAARARGLPLELERMRPPVAPDDANRHRAPQLRVERVMVRDHRDAGEQVLERADEETLAERMRAAASNGLVAGEPRPQVVDPFRRVRVPIAALQLPVV